MSKKQPGKEVILHARYQTTMTLTDSQKNNTAKFKSSQRGDVDLTRVRGYNRKSKSPPSTLCSLNWGSDGKSLPCAVHCGEQSHTQYVRSGEMSSYIQNSSTISFFMSRNRQITVTTLNMTSNLKWITIYKMGRIWSGPTGYKHNQSTHSHCRRFQLRKWKHGSRKSYIVKVSKTWKRQKDWKMKE